MWPNPVWQKMCDKERTGFLENGRSLKISGKIFERFSYFWETKFCEFCGFLGHPQNLIPTKTQKFDDSYNLMLTTFFVLSQPLYLIRKVSLGVFRNKISYTKLTWKFFFCNLESVKLLEIKKTISKSLL